MNAARGRPTPSAPGERSIDHDGFYDLAKERLDRRVLRVAVVEESHEERARWNQIA
jgi:hypothetical protein